MVKKRLNVFPVGSRVLIELDDDSARSGFIRGIGSEVPVGSNFDKSRAARGLCLGDRVVLRENIPDYYEFQFDRGNPESPTYCIIDMSDIFFIDNDRKYLCE
jgi:hypothetical protein